MNSIVGDDAWISRVLKLKELKLYYWMMMMVIGHNDYYRLRLGLRLTDERFCLGLYITG
jgi:hypothetical protein